MDIVISAFIGSDNLGDQAIAWQLASLLQKDTRVDTITALSRDPRRNATPMPDGVGLVKFSLPNLVRELRHADCLVLGGGGIINDESSIISLLRYYVQVLLARMVRKPVFWLFIGAGPVHTHIGHWLVRHMSRLVDYALVRDDESAELLYRHGFRKKQVGVAYDVVFNYPATRAKTPRKPSKPYLLFCPRDWFFLHQILPTKRALQRARRNPGSRLYTFRRELLKLLEQLLHDNPQLTVVGVPFYVSQDLDLLTWLHTEIDNRYEGRFQIQTEELTAETYVALAREAEGVAGVRLHSLILGAVAKRPLVALTYSSKVKHLARYLGLERYTVAVDAPAFGYQAAARKIERALRDPVPYADTVAQIADRNLAALDVTLQVMADRCR